MSLGMRVRGLLILIVALVTYTHAQFELPNEIFQRTLLIRNGREMGTGFKFEQDGRVYLVTSRHLAKGLPSSHAVVQVWHQHWIDFPTVRTLIPASKDVDLCIFETDETVAHPFRVVKSSDVVPTGKKVWYMGWTGPLEMPFGVPKQSVPKVPEIPRVRIGTVTGIDPMAPGVFQIHVEGVFDLRISTGPVVYWSTVHQDYEVLGVIKRNERDATKVRADPTGGEVVRTGLLEAYGIDDVVDIIRAGQSPQGQ